MEQELIKILIVNEADNDSVNLKENESAILFYASNESSISNLVSTMKDKFLYIQYNVPIFASIQVTIEIQNLQHFNQVSRFCKRIILKNVPRMKIDSNWMIGHDLELTSPSGTKIILANNSSIRIGWEAELVIMKHIHLEAEGTDRKIISIGSHTKFNFIKGSISRGSNNRLQVLAYHDSYAEFIDSNFYEGSNINYYKLTFLKSIQNSKLSFKNCKFIHKNQKFPHNVSEMELFGCTKMNSCSFLREREEKDTESQTIIILRGTTEIVNTYFGHGIFLKLEGLNNITILKNCSFLLHDTKKYDSTQSSHQRKIFQKDGYLELNKCKFISTKNSLKHDQSCIMCLNQSKLAIYSCYFEVNYNFIKLYRHYGLVELEGDSFCSVENCKFNCLLVCNVHRSKIHDILVKSNSKLMVANTEFKKNDRNNHINLYCSGKKCRIICDNNIFNGRDYWVQDDIHFKK